MFPSMNPAHVLFDLAAAHPDRVRFLAPERVTLGELAERVRSVASWLIGRGVRPGHNVAVWADNSLDMAVAMWAIQAAGAAFVTIHAPSTRAQADFILDHSQASLLISDAAHAPEADLVLGSDTWREALSTRAVQLPGPNDDDRACIIYTSGTTGDPKGVVLSHRNLWVNGEDWLARVAPNLPADAVEVHWLPLSHIFGWGALCIGTVFGLQTALTPFHDVLTALQSHRPHLLMGVPLLWDHLPPEATGGRLVLGLSGAAPLLSTTKQRYADAGIQLLEGYGLTETSPTLTLESPAQTDRDTVGLPYPSVEVRIADDGEVLARGPSVFAGYWRLPDAEQPFDADGWFHTGDLGEWRDGALRLVGRKKDLLVLSGGKKVAPAPIEARFPAGLGRLVLLGEGRHVRALVFTGDDVDPSAAIDGINADLPRHEQIRDFRVVSELPSVDNGLLTPSLKLRRHLVAARYAHLLET